MQYGNPGHNLSSIEYHSNIVTIWYTSVFLATLVLIWYNGNSEYSLGSFGNIATLATIWVLLEILATLSPIQVFLGIQAILVTISMQYNIMAILARKGKE